MKKYIGCLFFLMACFSVFSQNRTLEILGSNKIDCSYEALNYNVSEMVQNCEYVPLDKDAVFSLGRFFKFEVEGDYILIQGSRGLREELPCVLLFSKDGKLLAEIGKMGDATGEYREITAMAIDTLKREILITDQRLKRNLWYDFSGNYLRQAPAYRTVERLGKVYFRGENRLLGVQNISLSKKMAYFSTDRNFSRFDTLGYHRIAWRPGVVSFGCHPLSRYGEHCLMLYPFCDTIYEYTGEKVYPRYVTMVKSSVPENSRIPKDADYLELNKKWKSLGYAQKADIFETEKYVWIIYEGGNRIIYDKTACKGFFNRRKFQDHPTVITPLDFMGQSGEALVSLLSAEEILQMKEDYVARGVRPQGKLKKLFENVERDDNPVLIYYYFK